LVRFYLNSACSVRGENICGQNCLSIKYAKNERFRSFSRFLKEICKVLGKQTGTHFDMSFEILEILSREF